MDRPALKIEREAVANSTFIPFEMPPQTCLLYLNSTKGNSFPFSKGYYGELVDGSATAATIKIYYDPQYCNPDNTSQADDEAGREPSKCMDHISCTITQWDDNCHLVFRMQAGFISAACLIFKAVYMLIISIGSRHSNKTQCLTFGDAVIAARLCSLQLSSECMLDVGDSHRRRVTHECHQHCENSEVSSTGHENGHCRKCTKSNTTSELETFPTPARATKQKRPLISHLGQMGLVQLIVLCSVSAGALTLAALIVGICVLENDWDLITETNLTPIPVSSLLIELLVMLVTNFPQFFFSILYLFLIYNLTLINMEYEWGRMETKRSRLRCSIVVGKQFDQSYYLSLPKKVLIPTMSFSALVHWIVSLAFQVTEERYYTSTGYEMQNTVSRGFTSIYRKDC